jgi:hypothetical protein
MNIPIQLKDQLFCRVRYKEKSAFEKAWSMLESEYTQQQDLTWKNNITGELYFINENKKKVLYKGSITNYTYNTISKFQNENYGVLTGVNNLGVLDDDSPNKILMELYEKHFGETFRVRDHYYIKLLNWDCKKIIFYDQEGKHLGELQGKGQYVVGPNSIHPSGENYVIKNNLPIKEIEFVDLIRVFGDYIIKKEKFIREHKKTSWEGDDIKNIPISSIISFSGLTERGNYLQGPHPKHSSTTGMNFSVNNSQNTWYCFRCGSGGGPSELIAVMEGIIDCSQAGSNCFSKEDAQEVIKVAREKYGLKIPEINIEQKTPQGWANLISIKKMAKKHNFENCPICNSNFEFIEKLGWWKCPKCKIQGGLTKFANFILQNQRRISKND